MEPHTQRFTETVDHYIKYRPSYPKEILQLMAKQCSLTKKTIIADVGSGTGLLSIVLLENGNTVYGVEPNLAMRKAAEKFLENYHNFVSINGTAEETTLENGSVDIITVGTAFHWFDITQTKQEFRRILKKNGWVLLIWNVRDTEHSGLLREYENLILTYGKDYKESNARKFDRTAVQEFFIPHRMQRAEFPNTQQLDWEGFKGRLLSTSYSLRPDDNEYDEMIKSLQTIFKRYEKNRRVNFLYKTKLYFGQIHG